MHKGDRFKINAPHHAGRTYVVRSFDRSGLTAWDEQEMKYREEGRTLHCFAAVSLDGYAKAGQIKPQTIAEAINANVRELARLN